MGCSGSCSGCSGGCGGGESSLLKSNNQYTNIKKTIAVISGKGGVGKSLITSLLAVEANKKKHSVGIIDADITGPSIPRMFNVSGMVEADEFGPYPKESKKGVKIVSANLLLKNETDPILWRGSLISNIVEQFWTDFIWKDLDYMFVDSPPGTGDVSLTLFQSYKIDGIVIVTTPQELVSLIVKKAINMAKMMGIPILGIVQNFSYIDCDKCNNRIYPFGKGEVESLAAEYDLDILATLPIDQEIVKLADKGEIENIDKRYLKEAFEKIERKLKKEL